MDNVSLNEDTRRALAYLERDRLQNVDMADPLRHGDAFVVAQCPEGVLVNMDGNLMVSADDEATALALCGKAGEIESLLNHQDAFTPALVAAFGLDVQMTCLQVARFSREPMPAVPGVEVRPIGEERLAFVRRHYTVPVATKYLRDRLRQGVMVGAFVDGELAGFGGEHDEGTLGMLEVVPQYRRRGVGRAISAYLINRRLAQGRLGYGQVEVGNAISLAMQRRLGFEVGTQPVSWLSAPETAWNE